MNYKKVGSLREAEKLRPLERRYADFHQERVIIDDSNILNKNVQNN